MCIMYVIGAQNVFIHVCIMHTCIMQVYCKYLIEAL